jgi:hypothetical protein
MGMSGVSTLKAGHSIPAEADLGRFISRDPIGFRGGLNLFNGAGASPVTGVDPSGLDLQRIVDLMGASMQKGGVDFLNFFQEHYGAGRLTVTLDKLLYERTGNSSECDPDASHITLDSDYPDEVLALFLLHEFLHYAVVNNLSFIPYYLKQPRSLATGRGHEWIYSEEALAYEQLRNKGLLDPSTLDKGDEAFYNQVLRLTREPGAGGCRSLKYRNFLRRTGRLYNPNHIR